MLMPVMSEVDGRKTGHRFYFPLIWRRSYIWEQLAQKATSTSSSSISNIVYVYFTVDSADATFRILSLCRPKFAI